MTKLLNKNRSLVLKQSAAEP